MLSELVEVAERFSAEEPEQWLPAFYKWSTPKWVVEYGETGIFVRGPYKKGDRDQGQVLCPSRQRSGTKAYLNPLLLIDEARYVLGVGEGAEVQAAHEAYVSLLRLAAARTKEAEVHSTLGFLRDAKGNAAKWGKVDAGDVVAVKTTGSARFATGIPSVQAFWSEYLSQDCISQTAAACSVCGSTRPLLRKVPQEVVVDGQPCQITSFNKPSFESFGKAQTTNSPLCAACAAKATSALNFLVGHRLHHRLLQRDDRKGRSKNPLRSHLALFWLKDPVRPTRGGVTYDLEALMADFMGQDRPSTDEDGPVSKDAPDGPPPDLSQLESLLELPWSSREVSLSVRDNSFYLGVVSANNRRLVVRDWMSVSLDTLKQHLATFVGAMRIVGPYGETASLLPLTALIEALRAPNADVPRGLLRAAYAGQRPPECLRPMAVHRFPRPKPANERASTDALAYVAGYISTRQGLLERKKDAAQWALAAAMKLVLTFGSDKAKQEEARKMEALDATRNVPAYLCGRLLAILEGIQMQAADWKINATLVDRAYGTASTAPASIFGQLINRAESAHLPKIRKKYASVADKLKAQCDGVGEQLKAQGGFPLTLPLKDQAEFALGFYCERAEFRRNRPRKSQPAPEQKEEAEA